VPRVCALYRYPVKGFTPETCESLTILAEGRVAGDRVLVLRFADSPGDEWRRKQESVVLMNTPGLARLRVRFDHAAMRLRIDLEGKALADEALDERGRAKIASAVEEFVLALEENPLAGHPERRPLRLVGDGTAPRYTDDASGRVTLHGRASLASLGAALNDRNVSELRFRSNVALEGLEAWEELSWVGRCIRIGRMDFDVVAPKGRCLATHANPRTGVRDAPIMPTLVAAFAQQKPTFAVALAPLGAGEIRLGDEVALA
jgi:uncharacterized protein YcbX